MAGLLLPSPSQARPPQVYQKTLKIQVENNKVIFRQTLSARSRLKITWQGVCANKVLAKSKRKFIGRSSSFVKKVTLKPGQYKVRSCYKAQGKRYYVGKAKAFTIKPSPEALFFEDFSGTGSYDHSKFSEWSPCTYNASAAYGNIGCGDRAFLDGNGSLAIPASPTQGTSLSTKDTFTFTYGVVKARIKVPSETGYWPAFWTLNSTSKGESINGLVGEADILEAYTKYNDGYRSAAHNYSNGKDNGPNRNELCGNQDIRGAWHEYSARFEPGKIVFLFDGVACWTFTSADLTPNPYAFAPNHTAPNWLLLTNAVGNESQGMEKPTENSTLFIDYVKVEGL